ncbi:MAG: hypothetical protein AAGF13_11135 [Pseudomonadota bacterium]
MDEHIQIAWSNAIHAMLTRTSTAHSNSSGVWAGGTNFKRDLIVEDIHASP